MKRLYIWGGILISGITTVYFSAPLISSTITISRSDSTASVASIATTTNSFTLSIASIACENKVPKIVLNWGAVDNASSYSIYRKEFNRANFHAALERGIATTSFDDALWMPDYGRMQYSYRIQAKVNGGSVYSI